MHYFSFLVHLDTKRTNENATPKFTENPTQFAFEQRSENKWHKIGTKRQKRSRLNVRHRISSIVSKVITPYIMMSQ